MTRSHLVSTDQSLPVRLLLGLYRGCASLRLAVVLIVLLAVVLGWATFIDSWYSLAVAKYGIYRRRWFFLLGVLLALNVLCSALIRIPWKRRHVGFLITHAGILVLLFGCLITYFQGIDGEIQVVEGADPVHRAYLDSQHFELEIRSGAPGVGRTGPLIIPFRSGPFNWKDYDDRFWFPWCLAPRDKGVLYDQDGIRLEVLDYYSDSKYVKAPVLKLKVKNSPETSPHSSPHVMQIDDTWNSVVLGILPDIDVDPDDPNLEKYGRGDAGSTPDGTRVTFRMTGSPAETAAFRDGGPEGPLGTKGQVVLHAGGRKHHFLLDDFHLEKKNEEKQQDKPPPRFPLGDTGLEVDVKELNLIHLRVKLRVYRKGTPSGELWLYANGPENYPNGPESDQQDYENGVFGTYWFEPGMATSMRVGRRALRAAQSPRIDVLLNVLQGDDQELYYRTWAAPAVGRIGRLPTDGSKITAFANTRRSLDVAVDELFLPDTPGRANDTPGRVIPRDFVKPRKKLRFKRPQALVLLTVDGTAKEFWLAGRLPFPYDEPPQADQRRVVHGKLRSVTISLRRDEVDLAGFSLYLREFVKEMYAGTGAPREYSSRIDLFDRADPPERLYHKKLISMNVPMDFADPETGRSYRLTQQSYMGPWLPKEDYRIRRLLDGTTGDPVYVSVLGMNHDPGRGAKYFGSLIICIGVIMVLWSRISASRKARTQAVSAAADT